MNSEAVIEQLFSALIAGDRPAARSIVHAQAAEGADAQTIIIDLFWPTYELVERLHREDKLSRLSYQFATRLLRVLVDQVAAALPLTGTGPGQGRLVFAFCGPSDADELGAQMAVDLLEAAGFRVQFAGGNIANDEILAQVHEERPSTLLAFCSAPSDLPAFRALIDTMREIGACPDVQIAVGGGVFNRAEGLAEEMGVDLWAEDPLELADLLIYESDRRASAETSSGGRKRKSRSAA
ncbi:MAG: cobalamin-dependent protein [Phycisphaerales bacterium]